MAATLGLFLPLADSEIYTEVASNSLIQHTEGLVILALIVAAASALYGAISGHRGAMIGLILVGLALVAFLALCVFGDGLLTLQPAGARPDDLYGALDYIASTEKASPGVGLILSCLGSIAVLVGGIVVLREWRAEVDFVRTQTD